jgi:hypothetical protein
MLRETNAELDLRPMPGFLRPSRATAETDGADPRLGSASFVSISNSPA